MNNKKVKAILCVALLLAQIILLPACKASNGNVSNGNVSGGSQQTEVEKNTTSTEGEGNQADSNPAKSTTEVTDGKETGAEAGAETGAEAGKETGAETGAEAGKETGAETGAEAGKEAGAETGAEAGKEAGTKTGEEAGKEAGAETGAEAGKEAGTKTGEEADNKEADTKAQENPYVLSKIVDIYDNGYGEIAKTETTYQYYENGVEKYQEAVYTFNGETSIDALTYDVDERLIDEVHTTPGYSHEIKYEYDNEGKTISETEYEDGVKVKTYVYEYNEYGLKDKQYYYDKNDELVCTRISYYTGLRKEMIEPEDVFEGDNYYYTYDDEIVQTINADGSIRDYYTIVVDEQNRVTLAEREGCKYTFEYDEAGRTSYCREDDSYDGVTYETNYQYDSEGRQTLFSYLWNGKIQTLDESRYDDNGNLVYNCTRSDEEDSSRESTYTYDDNGNCIKVVTCDDGVTSVTTYTFDENGNVSLRKVEEGGKTYTDEYTFNKYGRLTDQKITDFDGRVTYIYKAECEYDEYGNVNYVKTEQDETSSAGDRYTTAEETRSEFDAEGGLIKEYSKSVHTYYYPDGSVETNTDESTYERNEKRVFITKTGKSEDASGVFTYTSTTDFTYSPLSEVIAK